MDPLRVLDPSGAPRRRKFHNSAAAKNVRASIPGRDPAAATRARDPLQGRLIGIPGVGGDSLQAEIANRKPPRPPPGMPIGASREEAPLTRGGREAINADSSGCGDCVLARY